MDKLPIHSLAVAFAHSLQQGPVVISAPTGSGKSTVVPRWCAEQAGRVLVVEPRRVACRSLARHVASELGVALGREVGYAVRHDERLADSTRIAFVTPGIALRMLAEGAHRRFPVVVLDEFHERSIEVDLLLGLLAEQAASLRLVVMSATLDGPRLAAFLRGECLVADGRLHPVTVEYAGEPLLPAVRGLAGRVAAAVGRLLGRPGDLLVFLPGRGEITACQAALGQLGELDVLPLHAGLRAEEQDRVFDPGPRRRVILATNVAETAVTLPRIGLVIDSGLVRQTRYRGARGYLTLGPVALDSAEQRRGRAGRLMPGHCLRLWSEAALLESTTPPELLREGLAVATLTAAACGRRLRAGPGPLPTLRLLDPPKDYAVAAAEAELQAMAALDEAGRLTPLGRRLATLPLDAHLGRILLAAEGGPLAAEAADLVAALSGGRPLFAGPRPEETADDLRASGCDATALIAALRRGRPERHHLHAGPLAEARAVAEQLRRLLRLPSLASAGESPPLSAERREALARLILTVHPQTAYIPRRRRRETAWANGRGEELELSGDSAVRGDEAPALVVVDTHAMTVKLRQTVQVITCAIPCTPATLRAVGLGEVRVGAARLERGRLVAEAIRSHAGLVLERVELQPSGALARQAVVRLLLDGALFRAEVTQSRRRISLHNLQRQLRGGPEPAGERVELESWLAAQLERVGLDCGDDLALLLPADLLFPELPAAERQWLERSFPLEVSVGDARYAVEYDERQREATLVKIAGQRTTLPPLAYLPDWPGWRLLHRDRAVVRVLRER